MRRLPRLLIVAALIVAGTALPASPALPARASATAIECIGSQISSFNPPLHDKPATATTVHSWANIRECTPAHPARRSAALQLDGPGTLTCDLAQVVPASGEITWDGPGTGDTEVAQIVAEPLPVPPPGPRALYLTGRISGGALDGYGLAVYFRVSPNDSLDCASIRGMGMTIGTARFTLTPPGE
ncbi:hypothetical protein DP939_21610 [Spongiactinospora rosea]|uniref:Ig-like domain-containing protein n=1 Tax=Spongiactinospora rosea TaxID=2248750 RepID=A0A366LWQ6_9ACTN|nr:hypothetical protein [Spongiactinospora rosea]RBQ17973.1 hypothetical protein DP939_21610 [Spongiactinospora rosea]